MCSTLLIPLGHLAIQYKIFRLPSQSCLALLSPFKNVFLNRRTQSWQENRIDEFLIFPKENWGTIKIIQRSIILVQILWKYFSWNNFKLIQVEIRFQSRVATTTMPGWYVLPGIVANILFSLSTIIQRTGRRWGGCLCLKWDISQNSNTSVTLQKTLTSLKIFIRCWFCLSFFFGHCLENTAKQG